MKRPRRKKHDQLSAALIPFSSTHASLRSMCCSCSAHASNSHLMTNRAIRSDLNLRTRERKRLFFVRVFRECHRSFILIVCGEKIHAANFFNSDLVPNKRCIENSKINSARRAQTSFKLMNLRGDIILQRIPK